MHEDKLNISSDVAAGSLAEAPAYTMGVDRTSDWMFALMNWSPSSTSGMVFNGADKLWSTMQQNMIDYINNNGGQAGYYPSKRFVARPDYSTVQDYLNGNITLDQLKQKIGCL